MQLFYFIYIVIHHTIIYFDKQLHFDLQNDNIQLKTTFLPKTFHRKNVIYKLDRQQVAKRLIWCRPPFFKFISNAVPPSGHGPMAQEGNPGLHVYDLRDDYTLIIITHYSLRIHTFPHYNSFIKHIFVITCLYIIQ